MQSLNRAQSQHEYANAMHLKPNLFQFPVDEQRMADLQSKLAQIFSRTKKSSGPRQNRHNESWFDEKPKFNWSVPPFVLMFLENIINSLSV